MNLSAFGIAILFCALSLVACSGGLRLSHIGQKLSRAVGDKKLLRSTDGKDWIRSEEQSQQFRRQVAASKPMMLNPTELNTPSNQKDSMKWNLQNIANFDLPGIDNGAQQDMQSSLKKEAYNSVAGTNQNQPYNRYDSSNDLSTEDLSQNNAQQKQLRWHRRGAKSQLKKPTAPSSHREVDREKEYKKLQQLRMLEEAEVATDIRAVEKAEHVVNMTTRRLHEAFNKMHIFDSEISHLRQAADMATHDVKGAQAQLADYEMRKYKAKQQVDALYMELANIEVGSLKNFKNKKEILSDSYNGFLLALDKRDHKEIKNNPEFSDNGLNDSPANLQNIVHYSPLLRIQPTLDNRFQRSGNEINYKNLPEHNSFNEKSSNEHPSIKKKSTFENILKTNIQADIPIFTQHFGELNNKEIMPVNGQKFSKYSIYPQQQQFVMKYGNVNRKETVNTPNKNQYTYNKDGTIQNLFQTPQITAPLEGFQAEATLENAESQSKAQTPSQRSLAKAQHTSSENNFYSAFLRYKDQLDGSYHTARLKTPPELGVNIYATSGSNGYRLVYPEQQSRHWKRSTAPDNQRETKASDPTSRFNAKMQQIYLAEAQVKVASMDVSKCQQDVKIAHDAMELQLDRLVALQAEERYLLTETRVASQEARGAQARLTECDIKLYSARQKVSATIGLETDVEKFMHCGSVKQTD